MKNIEQSLILIVDDNPKNIQVLGSLLKGKYRTAIATNGRDTLEFVSKRKPDLLLLDVMMPEMDGLEVCERLKKSPANSDIPVIFLSAKTETDDVIKGFKAGASDYVTKPFCKEELLSKVETQISLKKAENALRQALYENTQLLRDNKIAKESAEKASKAKSDFLASMSQEIRPLVNRIIGITDQTLQTHLTAEQKENLENVKDSANILFRTINDILDIVSKGKN